MDLGFSCENDRNCQDNLLETEKLDERSNTALCFLQLEICMELQRGPYLPLFFLPFFILTTSEYSHVIKRIKFNSLLDDHLHITSSPSKEGQKRMQIYIKMCIYQFKCNDINVGITTII